MTGFENWATSPSTVERDDTLDFESLVLKNAFREWAKHGAVPRRSAFTLRSAKAFLGSVMLFEQVAPSNYVIRLMGTGITAVLGEMQGCTITQAVPTDVAVRWAGVLDEVVSTLRPNRLVSRVGFANRDYLEAEIFLAPLLDNDDQATMVLAVIAFRTGVTVGHENCRDASRDPDEQK